MDEIEVCRRSMRFEKDLIVIPPLSLRLEITDLFNLAWPVIINRVGWMTLSVVDTIMVGQYSANHLAYFGLGQVPTNIVIVLQLGLLLGVQVAVANAYGAGDMRRCGALFWRAIPYALFLGLIGFVLCAFGEFFLRLSGQSELLAVAGGEISFILALSVPFSCLYLAGAFFLEGVRVVRPQMYIVLVANVVNIIANYMLVYGMWGAPELGAAGAAWASFVVRLVQAGTILLFIFINRDYIRFGLRHIPRPNWRAGARMRQIGYAAGLSLGIENGSFNVLTIFAGYLGAAAIAAQVITFNIFVIAFMFGLGISAATSVRVGNAYGAGDMPAAARAGWLGLVAVSVITGGLSFGFWIFADSLVGFYTTDSLVLPLTIALFTYSLVALVLDSAHSLLAQVLRAYNDEWFPTYVHFFAYGFLMIPLAYVSAFYWSRDVFGLMDGFILGTVFSLTIIAARFYWITKKMQR